MTGCQLSGNEIEIPDVKRKILEVDFGLVAKEIEIGLLTKLKSEQSKSKYNAIK